MTKLTPGFYEQMHDRLGGDRFLRRIAAQVEHASSMYGPGLGQPHLENIDFLARIVDVLLHLSLLHGRGRRNALDFVVEERTWTLPTLPAAFCGLRVLHLTDVHVDGLPDRGESLSGALEGLEFDLCVLTGDFRFLTHGPLHGVDSGLERLADSLRCSLGVYAVLGNHDFLEQVQAMESCGIRVLLNESVRLERAGQTLCLAGVDDPHFYGTHDLERAYDDIPPGACSVLLAHSPELYADAARAGAALYLCGHTHGGQICLPGGVPLVTHSTAPRSFSRGAWRHGVMPGYTSRGVGCSGVAARFNCPPEITVHVLHGDES